MINEFKTEIENLNKEIEFQNNKVKKATLALKGEFNMIKREKLIQNINNEKSTLNYFKGKLDGIYFILNSLK
jgi:hypothetical protein